MINLVATVVNEKAKENPSLWTRSWRPLGLVQILGGLNIVSKHDVYFPFSFQVPKHMYIDINEKILFLFLLRLLHYIFLYIYCFFLFFYCSFYWCVLQLGLGLVPVAPVRPVQQISATEKYKPLPLLFF